MERAVRCFALAGALMLATITSAEMPYPPNPRPCASPDPSADCIEAGDFAEYLFLPAAEPPLRPDDFRDDWKLTSDRTGDPAIDASPQELYGVKGASVDLAWQVTTGRPDVVIAVLDSGIRWGEALPDLVNKFYLNRGELPVPEGSTNESDPHDRNADGFFTVQDYLAGGEHAADSRVSDQNGNGMIDPEDLIFLFSDGVDDDRNGYIDDISGWDFFEDDNNPLDEVRYGHGTGQSEDSAAEANNGIGRPGTCPNCLLLEVRVADSFVAEVNAFAEGVVFAVDSGASVIQEALGALNQSRFGQQAIDYAYRNGVPIIASAADEQSNHHNYPANYNHTIEVNSVVRYAEFGPLVQSPRSYLYLNGCTNYGGHIAFSVPSSSCSSEATGLGAGMAALVVSAGRNAVDRKLLEPYPRDDGTHAPFALSAEEVKQILTATADDIDFDARDDFDPPLPQNYFTAIGVPGIERSERFPSIAGWDQYFGYGRVNADRAVRRVAEGLIPPEAAMVSPDWFDVIDPSRTSSLPIEGRAAANRARSFSYAIQTAPGIQPRESDFVTELVVADGVSAIEGVLGSIDIGRLRDRMPHGVSGPAITAAGAPDPDRFTFTVRLRVTDDRGNTGEDRRVLALHEDPDLLPGFPLRLGADGASSPAVFDLDGDGVEEIVLGTSNGEVHAYRADGSELPGFPVATDPLELHLGARGYASGAVPAPVHAAITGPVTIGDLDRNGEPEIVAADLQGKVYVWNARGERRAGFPVATLPEYSHAWRSERAPDDLVPDRTNRKNRDNRLGRSLLGGAVLGNLDGSEDGSLEIVAGAFDRHVYAWRHDGTPVPGWPVLLKDPAKVESVDPVTNEVTLVEGSGARIGSKIIVPPSLGDLDGDGRLEVVAVVNEEYVEEPNAVFTNPVINLFRAAGVLRMGNTRVYAIHAEGAAHGGSGMTRGWNPDAFLPGWPVKTALLTTELLPLVGTGSNGPPALADLDGDGRLEVATFSAVGPAYVFTADGESFFGRHPTGEDVTLDGEPLGALSDAADSPTFPALGAPVLAELGGPGGGFQLLAPAAGIGKLIDNQLPARQIPAENHLAAWNVTAASGTLADGKLVTAFPRRVNDLQFLAGPAVADIDGDGLPEALQGTGVYDLHAIDIAGREPPGWPKFTGGWMIGSPAVGDIDGDGLLEVVATTREGHLFAWRTAGDECGPIPWRRAHRDEWGTGNHHMDTRPPGVPAGTSSATVLGPARARIDLKHFPGDDLYCGTATRLDVRFAARPITGTAEFAAATPVENVTAPAMGSRTGGSLVVEDERFRGETVHLALVAFDEAENRSPVAPLGAVAFATLHSPTATATPAATATPTDLPAGTPTSVPRSPTSAARAASNDDDGCAVTPAGSGPAGWLLVPFVLLALRRRFPG